MSKNTKRGLLFQASILATAGIISRVIGLLYGSPLAAIIGDEGNGYYATASEIYAIILLISSYSIPSAMAKIISQKLAVNDYINTHRIFLCALVYVTIVGASGGIFIFFFANYLAVGRSAIVLRFYAPTIFLFGYLGVLRGYFQAHRTMVPTSVSQLVEQIINAITSIGAAIILTNIAGSEDSSKRAVYGAIGGTLGTSAGVVLALLFMICIYCHNRKSIIKKIEADTHPKQSKIEIFILIFLVVTPFIFSTFIYNFSTSLNATLFSRILLYVRKLDETDIATMYGVFSRKAMTIIKLPISIASAVAAAMIPEISSLYAKGDNVGANNTITKVTKITIMITIPCAVGLFCLSKPVIMILFPQKESMEQAAYLLRMLSISVVFYSLSTVTNAVLQGMGKIILPVINAFLALIIQTTVLILLLLYTNIGTSSLCIVTIIYSLLMCILNSLSIKKLITTTIDYKKTYVFPVISATFMGCVVYLLYLFVNYIAFYIGNIPFISYSSNMLFTDFVYSNYIVNLVSTIISIFVGICVYFVALIRTGGTTEEEIIKIPKGKSIVLFLKNLHLINTTDSK